jgi:hypothetical protein
MPHVASDTRCILLLKRPGAHFAVTATVATDSLGPGSLLLSTFSCLLAPGRTCQLLWGLCGAGLGVDWGWSGGLLSVAGPTLTGVQC